jgi:hypothetical protein
MQTRSREGRSDSDRATVGRTTSPFGDSFGVCSPLPQRRGSAACLRDIPCGNVVSRWTFGERDSPNPADWHGLEHHWLSKLGVGLHWLNLVVFQLQGFRTQYLNLVRTTSMPNPTPDPVDIATSRNRRAVTSAGLALLAVLAPIGLGLFLASLAGSIYTAIDAGSSNALALVPIGLALLLPSTQIVPDLIFGQSKLVHVFTILMVILSWPWYFMLLFLVSWGHH